MSDTKPLGVGHNVRHVKNFFKNTAAPWLTATTQIPPTTYTQGGWSRTPRTSIPAPPGLTSYPEGGSPLCGFSGQVDGFNTSPADMVAAPLTSALEQLVEAVKPSVANSRKGIQLRPEYHVQHVDLGISIKLLDYQKVTYHELLSGMCRVLDFIVSVNGDANSYLEHMSLVTKKASLHRFINSVYVGYD